MKVFRRVVELVDYYVGSNIGWRNPLLPPSWLHSVGNTDFVKTGDEFFRHFIDVAQLKPHESVLDVGCGTGRMAMPLAKYLSNGSYHGMDIVEKSINWCQKTYKSLHPNFKFHYADIYNKEYNPDGKQLASKYRFPFADASFDFVFLTSVVTHMLPQDTQHYLEETSRVLKPGGRCLITWFLLNDESRSMIDRHASQIAFVHELPGCWVKNPAVPELAVAYPESAVRSWYQQCMLTIAEPVKYGSWCGRQQGFSFQDMIIANKV